MFPSSPWRIELTVVRDLPRTSVWEIGSTPAAVLAPTYASVASAGLLEAQQMRVSVRGKALLTQKFHGASDVNTNMWLLAH